MELLVNQINYFENNNSKKKLNNKYIMSLNGDWGLGKIGRAHV